MFQVNSAWAPQISRAARCVFSLKQSILGVLENFALGQGGQFRSLLSQLSSEFFSSLCSNIFLVNSAWAPQISRAARCVFSLKQSILGVLENFAPGQGGQFRTLLSQLSSEIFST